MAQRLPVLDIAAEAAALVSHLPDLTLWAAPHLGHAWLVDPDTNEVWIEDTEADTWTEHLLAALGALAAHHGIVLHPVARLLSLVPVPRAGA